MDERQMRLEAAQASYNITARGLDTLIEKFEAMAAECDKQAIDVLKGILDGAAQELVEAKAGQMNAMAAAFRYCAGDVDILKGALKEQLSDPIEITKRELLLNQSRGETKRQ